MRQEGHMINEGFYREVTRVLLARAGVGRVMESHRTGRPESSHVPHKLQTKAKLVVII